MIIEKLFNCLIVYFPNSNHSLMCVERPNLRELKRMLLIFYIFDDDFRVCLGQEIINISHRQPSSRLNLTQLTFYSHFLRLHINLYHKENNKVSFQISWINIFKHVIRCHLCITTIYSYFFFCFSKRTLLKAFT